MTKEELLQKLTDIEWDDFECKAAQDKLPDDVWSTVSAFSNTLVRGTSWGTSWGTT
jgi:ATP-dependent DNA helicase RecG